MPPLIWRDSRPELPRWPPLLLLRRSPRRQLAPLTLFARRTSDQTEKSERIFLVTVRLAGRYCCFWVRIHQMAATDSSRSRARDEGTGKGPRISCCRCCCCSINPAIDRMGAKFFLATVRHDGRSTCTLASGRRSIGKDQCTC